MSETTVRQIPRDSTKRFILGIHYARRMPSIMFSYGLFVGPDLVGCVTYGKPASPFLCEGIAGKSRSGIVIELNRLCIDPTRKGENFASMLVGKSLRMLPGGLIVVSYADTAWAHFGYVYQATNFTYTGMTNERTDMASVDGSHSRHNMGDRDLRQLRSAKHRYHFITGTKKQKKEIASHILYSALPYPKGTTHKYNTMTPEPSDSRFMRATEQGLFA